VTHLFVLLWLINSSGTLYVTEEALCFYSDLFKTKISLPFGNIALVLREATLGVDTALSVRTTDRTIYMFRSFLSREMAFEMISSRAEAARKSAESLHILDTLYIPKKAFAGFEIPKLSFGKKST
jgi:hypothetical protein